MNIFDNSAISTIAFLFPRPFLSLHTSRSRFRVAVTSTTGICEPHFSSASVHIQELLSPSFPVHPISTTITCSFGLGLLGLLSTTLLLLALPQRLSEQRLQLFILKLLLRLHKFRFVPCRRLRDERRAVREERNREVERCDESAWRCVPAVLLALARGERICERTEHHKA
jgi:hypothetical protein